LISVTPMKMFYWPTRDFGFEPALLDLKEVRDVAAGR